MRLVHIVKAYVGLLGREGGDDFRANAGCAAGDEDIAPC
jgi:hypothetical protein